MRAALGKTKRAFSVLLVFVLLGWPARPVWQERQPGPPLDLETVAELLSSHQAFSLDAVLELVEARKVNFDLTDAARRRLLDAAQAGRRDARLVEVVLDVIAKNCVACPTGDCKLAQAIRSGISAESLFRAIASGQYPRSDNPRIVELLLGGLPAQSRLSGAMLALLCRLGAPESRQIETLNKVGILVPSEPERQWISESCPEAVISWMDLLLAPSCADGQTEVNLQGAHVQPSPRNGWVDLALRVDEYVGIQAAGATACIEVLKGGTQSPPSIHQYVGGPLPSRPLDEWEFAVEVLDGAPSRVLASAVPAHLSRKRAPSIRLLIDDRAPGTHRYHVRLHWALKRFSTLRDIERCLERVWFEEFMNLLRDVQRRGISFQWSGEIISKLRQIRMPAEVEAALLRIKPDGCDPNPYSFEDLSAAIEMAVERYTTRSSEEIAGRGVAPGLLSGLSAIGRSPLWNASVVKTVAVNARDHNRPTTWPR